MSHCQLDIPTTLEVFQHYLQRQNLHEKKTSELFLDDTPPLLRSEEISKWDPTTALAMIHDRVISQMAGEAWKGECCNR